jgi:hypothetical protein
MPDDPTRDAEDAQSGSDPDAGGDTERVRPPRVDARTRADGGTSTETDDTSATPFGMNAPAASPGGPDPMAGNRNSYADAIRSRAGIRQAMGEQFGGDRSVYDTLGYDKDISVEQYWARYLRQDIARTIVDAPATTTWSERPQISDDDDTETETAFEQAVRSLWEDVGLLGHLRTADRLEGIGHFGVLILGLSDGASLDEPVDTATLSGEPAADIAYVTPLAEDSVDRIETVQDPDSDRFGRPVTYEVDFTSRETAGSVVTQLPERNRHVTVHHTRVVHLAENTLDSRIIGRPRLEPVYNRLTDLQKTVGSAAEMAWRGADYGLALSTDPEAVAQMSPQQREAMEDSVEQEAQAWYHGLQPYMRLSGMDVEALGGEQHDPSGTTSEILKLISGETRIPVRILTGSERGELASTQDRATWLSHISQRQQNYAEPEILRPLLDLLVQHGVLPAPEGARYDCEWPSLFELSEVEQADVADKQAGALKKAATALVSAPLATEGEVRHEVFGWGPEIGSEVGEAEAEAGGGTADSRPDPDPPADADAPDDVDETNAQVTEQWGRLRDGMDTWTKRTGDDTGDTV